MSQPAGLTSLEQCEMLDKLAHNLPWKQLSVVVPALVCEAISSSSSSWSASRKLDLMGRVQNEERNIGATLDRYAVITRSTGATCIVLLMKRLWHFVSPC
jgi:hypothetical protein